MACRAELKIDKNMENPTFFIDRPQYSATSRPLNYELYFKWHIDQPYGQKIPPNIYIINTQKICGQIYSDLLRTQLQYTVIDMLNVWKEAEWTVEYFYG